MNRKSQLNYLETIFPPFTNRNVKFLKEKANENIAALLMQSKFYMIGARAQTIFVNWKVEKDSPLISLDIKVGDDIVDSGIIDVSKFDEVANADKTKIIVGQEAILIGATPKGTHAKVWLTPDSIYWRKARNDPYIIGFDNHEKVCTYDLLYVGIATKQDSYTRLIKNAHHKRVQILSEEPQRKAGSHLSDEIILFFYDIEPFRIAIDTFDEKFSTYSDDDHRRVVADAEKAFVSFLLPTYNDIKFHTYPKGVDGLYGTGLDHYSYVINENFIFRTLNEQFKGCRGLFGPIDNRQDSITVEGDKVEMFFGNEKPEGLEPQSSKILRNG
jgi:hypothetical protein